MFNHGYKTRVSEVTLNAILSESFCRGTSVKCQSEIQAIILLRPSADLSYSPIAKYDHYAFIL